MGASETMEIVWLRGGRADAYRSSTQALIQMLAVSRNNYVPKTRDRGHADSKT